MPAINPKTLDAWTPGNTPPALKNARIVLIHGTDEGGICALAADLTRTEGPPVRLPADGLMASDLHARLTTGGLFGPPTPIRVTGANDKHTPLFEKINPTTNNALLIVEAGVLKKESKLKALFETKGISIALTPLEGPAAGNWLAKACTNAGLPLGKNALTGALERLPSDRMRLTRLAEVLVLHALGRNATQVEQTDITAVVGQEADVALTQALNRALAGDLKNALIALDTQLSSGENPIALIRAWSWKLQRLDDMIRSGLQPAAAVAAARPPVFFSERKSTEQALQRMGQTGIAMALVSLNATEHHIIHNNYPHRVALERWLLKLATWKGTP